MRLRRKLLHSRGFTLPEVLVAITLTTFIGIVVSDYMIQNIQQSTFADIRATQLNETEQSLDFAANDIRLSASADINNRWPDTNSPGAPANLYSWASNTNTLVLATAAQDTAGNILFSDAQNYISQKNNIIYFVSNGTLYKRTLAASVAGNGVKTSCPTASSSTACPPDKELLHNVTLFTVTYLDGTNQSVTATNAESIELHITVKKHIYSQDITSDYTTRMVFRNG